MFGVGVDRLLGYIRSKYVYRFDSHFIWKHIVAAALTK